MQESNQTELVDAEIAPAQEIKQPAAQVIAVNPLGLIVARDNAELYRMISLMMKGMAFPKTLDTMAKVVAAWQVAASLKLPPAVAIQNLAVIHGSVCMWGQLPKALAEGTGQMEDFKLIYFDPAQKVISLDNKNLDAPVWGAATQMRRTKRSMNEYFFTEVEAKKAGLLNKAGPWTDYRKIMYARRTVGHAIKFEFPDAVMGVGIAEYDFHEAPDLKDVTPSQTRDELVDKLAKRADNNQNQSPVTAAKDET